MMKRLKTLSLILIIALLPLLLIGCSDSKTLKSSQYVIFHQGNNFTIKITDSDFTTENVETVKVKIRYKYAEIEYGNGSVYASDIKTKTKTETFEVEKFDNLTGNFMGGFQTEYDASEFECKKVVAYYVDGSNHGEGHVSIPAALGLAVGFFVLGIIILFSLSLTLISVDTAIYTAAVPYLIAFIAMLISGQWIPAIIFFLGMGAFVSVMEAIKDKFDF